MESRTKRSNAQLMTDILHVPFTYFPDPTGGTETYVAALARGMRAKGIASAVAAPVERGEAREYEHDGLRVYRFATSGADLPLEDVYGEGDPVAAEAFARLLATVRPRVVHLHGWTSGLSLRLLRAARRAGYPVAFTYHTPSVSCARGNLMLYGRQVCDGALFVDRCSRCVLQQHGIPLTIGTALAELPTGAGRVLRRLGLEGGVWTALRMTELIQARHRAFFALLAETDALVAVQDWVYRLLLALGAPSEKLTLSRLALPDIPTDDGSGRVAARERGAAEPIRLAFFGRIDRDKGAHIVIAAVRALPGAALTLDIYGAPQGADGTTYLHELQRMAAGDPRIRFFPAVPTREVAARMREHDVLVVPSIWMETGPLVIPEAMAVGVPVIGSARGGIPSFIRDGIDGLLAPPGDVEAWTATLRRLVDDPSLLSRLTSGVRPPETMARIVDEMVGVYSRLTNGSKKVT